MRRLLTGLLVLGCACDDGSSGAAAEAGWGTIKLSAHVVAGAESGDTSQLRVGSASASSLLSLKYYVTSIQLCEDLELMGSGYNNARGCIQLYNNMGLGAPDYDTYTIEDARTDDTPGHYVDLMTREGRAALEQPVTLRLPLPAAAADGGMPAPDAGEPAAENRPGVYRYGLINFYRPIKVKAEFPILGEPGQYYRTKTVTAIHDTPGTNGGLGNERVEIGDTLSGETEETVYMMSNGGVLFTFQKPFAVTREDLEAEAQIAIDLAFNPENFGQAYNQPCANDPNTLICDPQNGVVVDMPFVHMSPVPRKGQEQTRKETYLIDYEEHSQLRIELYYNDADPERSVQGIDTAIVYDASAASATAASRNVVASNFVAQTGSVRTDDATLRLLDYQRTTNLDGLRRRQDGNVEIQCLFVGSICPSLGGSVARAYRYEGDTVVTAP